MELPAPLHEGRAEQRVYLLLGPAGARGEPPATRLLPDTPAARAHLASHAERPLRVWRANATTGAPASLWSCEGAYGLAADSTNR
jgi:hypothetical protein